MKIHLSFASLLLLVSHAVVATPVDVEDSSQTSVSNSGNKRPLPRSFGLVVFPAFQAFDVFGPLDALNVLGSLHKLDLAIISSSLSPVSTLISDDPDHNPMNSTMFQRIVPTHTYSTAPSDLEVLIVPGGGGLIKPVPGTIEPLMEFIKKTFPKLRYLITICNGSGLVARTGVLDYRRATTNKLLFNSITSLAPKVKWIGKARWVEDGKVWTSSGVSAGVDATLAWIEKVYGEEDAAHVARILEYTRLEDSSEDPWWDYYNN